tara:strand:- start:1890 stop:2375 length:486 start_codon:yes stop_codon:yes gene_type:complete
MSEFRERTTGEVKSQAEWKLNFPNMSLPQVWSASVCDALNIDPVLPSPAATTTAYQTSVRDGVEKDSDGNWIEKYVARDMFATDGDGSKEDKETAYQATLDTQVSKNNRNTRDLKLAETDFYALSDVTMSSEMQSYRQSLRDLPTHSNWPNLSNSDWPTKP